MLSTELLKSAQRARKKPWPGERCCQALRRKYSNGGSVQAQAGDLQDAVIEFATALRFGTLPDESEVGRVVENIERLSGAWKSLGRVDSGTAHVFLSFYPMVLGSAPLFAGQERERFSYIVHQVAGTIARALTDDCPTLRDMVRASLAPPALEGDHGEELEPAAAPSLSAGSAFQQRLTSSRSAELAEAVAGAEEAVAERRPNCIEQVCQIQPIVAALAPQWRISGCVTRGTLSLLMSIYPALDWALESRPFEGNDDGINEALNTLQDFIESSLGS